MGRGPKFPALGGVDCDRMGARRGGLSHYAKATRDREKTNKKKEKQMKRAIMTIIMMLITMPVFAATMCVKNDTISIVLDPAIGDTSNSTYSYNTAQSTWWTAFPYGTIHGISACLSSNYSQSLGGYVAQLTDNGERVVGGETNGLYCWCKMTHPAVSLWVFNNSYSSADVCAGHCAYNCGYNARYNSALRGGLFGSVRN